MSGAKNKGNQAEQTASRRNLAIGIVIVVLIAAIIAWANWPKSANAVAVTIGEENYKAEVVNYYYAQAYNQNHQMTQMYAQFGMESPYDANKSAKEQIYEEESGKTYDDYFREEAFAQLQQLSILLSEAEAAGHSLSAEGKEQVEKRMKDIDSQILQYRVTQGGSENYYLKAMYGATMSKSLLREIFTKEVTAGEFAEKQAASYSYDQAALESYYQENSADLDSYDYQSHFFQAKPETGVDEEGNALEATEEQKGAAMDIARESARAMAAELRAGADFALTAQKYADQGLETPADPVNTTTVDALGSELSGALSTWLKDAARRPGQIDLVEDGSNGVYVVRFTLREQRAASVETVTTSSLKILAETTQSTDAEGNSVTAPSEEQLSAAMAKAEEAAARFAASADKSDEAFAQLIDQLSEEQIVLAAETTRTNDFGTEFKSWAFDPNTETQPGDCLIVPALDDTGATVGYTIVKLNEFGQTRWIHAAETALRDADYTAWFDALKEQYPITPVDAGLAQVGMDI